MSKNKIDPNSNFNLKLKSGLTAAILSNSTAIPMSKIFNEVAHDTQSKHILSSHLYRNLSQLRQSVPNVYLGGCARFTQKATVATANAFIPTNLVIQYPIWTAAAVGFVTSPVSNFFKMLQINKIAGYNYYSGIKLIFTRNGIEKYIGNTSYYCINETVRSASCFGFSQYVRQELRARDNGKPSVSKMIGRCLIASSVAAFIETIVSAPIEIYTAVHGKFDKGHKVNVLNILKFFRQHNMLRGQYLLSCTFLLMMKNLVANIGLTLVDESQRQGATPLATKPYKNKRNTSTFYQLNSSKKSESKYSEEVNEVVQLIPRGI